MFVGFSLLIAVLYDFFIWDKQPGIGFLLFVCIYLLGFLSIVITTKQMRQKLALLLLAPIIVLSIDVILFNNVFIRNQGLFFVAVFLVLFSLLLTLETNKQSFDFFNIPFIRSFVAFPLLEQIGNVFSDIKLATGKESEPYISVSSIITGYDEKIKRYNSPLEFNFGIYKVQQLLMSYKF
jgi:hypothetical protein